MQPRRSRDAAEMQPRRVSRCDLAHRSPSQAGVSPDRIVYANPCKQPSHLRFAAAAGVRLSVFDSEAELLKTAAEAPSAELLLRIQVDDSKAVCVMSNKYGAPLAEAPPPSLPQLGLDGRDTSAHPPCYA